MMRFALYNSYEEYSPWYRVEEITEIILTSLFYTAISLKCHVKYIRISQLIFMFDKTCNSQWDNDYLSIQFQELSFEKIRVNTFNLLTWCKILDSLAIT